MEHVDGRRPASRSRRSAPWALRGVGGLLAVAFAFPAAYLVWRNFTTGADPLQLLTSHRTLGPLWRTLRLAVLVSLSTAVLGTTLAWLTVRTRLPIRRGWLLLMPIPLVFPTFIGAAAFIRTLNPGGLLHDLLANVGFTGRIEMRGLFGAWLVLTLFTFPYVFLTVAARLQTLPRSWEDQARVLGDAPGRLFFRVTLPQISGSISAGTLLVFLYTISDFGAVQLMRYDTLTRAIHVNHLARPDKAFALSLILLVLAGLVVASERTVSRKLPVTASKASPVAPARYELGRWRWPALGLVGLVAAGGIVAPVAALLDWASYGFLDRGRSRPLTIDRGDVLEAAWNTVHVSALAAAAAVAAVLPIALLVGRYRDRLGNVFNGVVIATFALPGILIALSLRFWTLRSGAVGEELYDTMTLLVFAFVVRFGSLAMGVTLVSVRAVPQQLRDAASLLGAGWWRRFRTVDLPVMAPGLFAAGGLVALSVMKELPISLLLAPLGFVTLTTRIFNSFEEAFVIEAGIFALVLVAMSAVLSYVLVLRRPLPGS